jgi:hypothetical protein
MSITNFLCCFVNILTPFNTDLPAVSTHVIYTIPYTEITTLIRTSLNRIFQD